MNDLQRPIERGTVHRRRRRRLLVAGGVVALLVWVGAAGVLVAGAATDLRAGERTLRQARADLDLAALVEPGGDAPLLEAGDDLRAAERRLRSPVLAPARWLPVVGRQLRSATALAGAAADALDTGTSALTDVRAVVDAGVGEGPERVTAARALADVARGAGEQLAGLDLGPDEALFAPLADARAEVGEQVDELYEAAVRGSAVADGLADLLAGPRRYLVLATNSAEMDAGWGMPLSSGTLEIEDGQLRLVGLADLDENVPAGAVELTGDLARNWADLAPNRDWRNLGLTPRFDEAAPLAARMREAVTGEAVDGVLAVDPVALQAVLAATGPVEVAGTVVDADTVLQYAVHDQYVEAEVEGRSREERKEHMAEIAAAVFGRLSSGTVDVPALVRGLADAAAGRHLLAWSSAPGDAALWTAAAADGHLQANSVLVALVNRGGNKLDWFVDVDAHLDATRVERPGGGADLEVALRVHVANRTPPGEPTYVAGPWPGAGARRAGDYVGIVSVHLPGATSAGSVDGVDALLVAGTDGPTRVLATPVAVLPGEDVDVVVRFTIPADAAMVRIEPSARARPLRWHAGDQAWTHDRQQLLDLAALSR